MLSNSSRPAPPSPASSRARAMRDLLAWARSKLCAAMMSSGLERDETVTRLPTPAARGALIRCAVAGVEQGACAIIIAGRGHDALRHLPFQQQTAGDGVMPPGEEAFGAVNGIDHPGASRLRGRRRNRARPADRLR